MELGDKVIFYTHEASDSTHRAIDRLAFVTGIVDEQTIDVVVFPPGGPLTFERVSAWDSKQYEGGVARPVGLNYWRPAESAPPDLAPAKPKAKGGAK